METISNYLETMFMNVPKNEQTKRAKMELLTMMEDKYNELKADGKSENEAVGTVISEFGNLDELAEVLGISKNDYRNTVTNIQRGRMITKKTVEEFMAARGKYANMIALGVMLCIFSVIPSIIAELVFSQKAAEVLGCAGLFIFVGTAVMIFIMSGGIVNGYKFLLEEDFYMDYATIDYIKKSEESYQNKKRGMIAIGVILCIFSVMFVAVVDEVMGEISADFATSLMLAIVAVAVYLFVNAGVTSSTYNILLKRDENGKPRKMDADKSKAELIWDAVSGLFWVIIVFGYLGVSIAFGNWHITWIVFPIAGSIFAAIKAIIIAVTQK